jgi:hypothetical protein
MAGRFRSALSMGDGRAATDRSTRVKGQRESVRVGQRAQGRRLTHGEGQAGRCSRHPIVHREKGSYSVHERLRRSVSHVDAARLPRSSL